MKDLYLTIAHVEDKSGCCHEWYSFDYSASYNFLTFYCENNDFDPDHEVDFAFVSQYCIPVPDDYEVTSARNLYEDVFDETIKTPAMGKLGLLNAYKIQYEYIVGEDPFFMH